jgi:uncharacterized small protein (DUF1192 family)
MRRTHASLSRKAGTDPKLVADQLGHGIGVNLGVYTIADLEQRLAAVNTLEQSFVSTAIQLNRQSAVSGLSSTENGQMNAGGFLGLVGQM